MALTKLRSASWKAVREMNKFTYRIGDVVEAKSQLGVITWKRVDGTFEISPITGGHFLHCEYGDLKLIAQSLPQPYTDLERCSVCGNTFFAGHDCSVCSA
jgi:hypothetical protein